MLRTAAGESFTSWLAATYDNSQALKQESLLSHFWHVISVTSAQLDAIRSTSLVFEW